MKIGKMILKIVLGLFVVLMVCGIGTGVLINGSISKEQSDKETVLKADGDKKVLILYQESRFGVTKKVVNKAAETFQANGYTVVMNHPRKDNSYTFSDYDIVVLSSPVYAAKVSQPLLDAMDQKDFSNNKVLILLTGDILDEMGELNMIKDKITNAKEIQSIKVKKADSRLTDVVKALIEQ